MSRRALLLIASMCLSMCLAFPSIAQVSYTRVVRPPRILVAVNTENCCGNSWEAPLWQAQSQLRAAGCEYNVVLGPHNKPLIAYSQGKGNFWGLPYDYDGLVLIGAPGYQPPIGWGLTTTRFDSMTRVGKYPTIPVFWHIGLGGAANLSGTACSTGVSGALDKYAATSILANANGLPGGTYYQIPIGASQYADPVANGNAAITKLLSAGGDTTFAWRKACGSTGITFAHSSDDGNDKVGTGFIPMLVAFGRFIADLPDTVRPRQRFPFALVIDDAFKRDKGNPWASCAFEEMTMVRGVQDYMDSLASRDIAKTVGVEANKDTLDALDVNGKSIFVNDYAVYNRGRTRYYTHVHTGVNIVGGAFRAKGLSYAAQSYQDLYGRVRARDCSPNYFGDTSPVGDSSFVMGHYGANQLMWSRFGFANWSSVAGPPQSDYYPTTVQSSRCAVQDIYESLRRAGYTAILTTVRRVNIAHGKNLASGATSGGGESAPRIVSTQYGDIKLISTPAVLAYIGAGTGTGDSAAVSDRHIRLKNVLLPYFTGGWIMRLNTTGDDHPVWSGVMLSHVRNWIGSSPGWQVVRDYDNVMRAYNYNVGYQAFYWTFPEDLPPSPPWVP